MRLPFAAHGHFFKAPNGAIGRVEQLHHGKRLRQVDGANIHGREILERTHLLVHHGIALQFDFDPVHLTAGGWLGNFKPGSPASGFVI